jgi:signal transduction histidine kinase/DNA-binding response OmpR family regulator/ligand-binding sensor domain-containing protein
MKNWWLLLLLPLFALPQPGRVRDITIASGLSQGMVFSMLQDRDGFVWIATKNGLNRYDGYNFKVYYKNPTQPFSISENTVTALFEDSHGRLWVGTNSQGINLLDRRTQRFYHANFETTSGLDSTQKTMNPSVSAISESPDGSIWLGTSNSRLLRITLPANIKNGFPDSADFTRQAQFVQMPPFHRYKMSDYGVTDLRLSDNRKCLWMTANEEYYTVDYNHGKITKLQTPQFSTPAKATGSNPPVKQAGSWVVAKGNQLLRVAENGATNLLYTLPANLFGLHLGAKAGVWITIGDSVYHIPYITSNGPVRPTPVFKKQHELEYLTCSMADKQGNIWIGTNGYGVKKWVVGQTMFNHVLAGKSIWHVYQDRQRRVYVWDFVFPYLMDSLTGQKSKTELLPQYKGLNKGKMTQGPNGDVWWVIRKDAETRNMLLVHLDSNLHTIKEYDLRRPAYFQRTAVLEDRRGFIWVGGANSCLIRFNPGTGQAEYFDYSQYIAKTEPVNGVLGMYEDRQGQIWVCTQDGLLRTRWEGEKLGFQYFRSNPQKPNSLPNNHVTAVVDDPVQPDRYLWIATHGGGLVKMDKATLHMRHFNEKNGLLSNNVVGIVTDNQRDIWISTYRGLYRLNTKTMVFSNYSEQDGLQSDEFNTAVYFKNNVGQLFFGGINGLNIFTPQPDWEKPAPATVKIIGLQLNNEAVQPGDSTGVLSQSIEYQRTLRLRHQQNQLTFEFATLDLNNAPQTRYRYQMVGIDGKWVEGGTNRFANYAQLPPGHYTLRVIASADGASWSATPTELDIVIYPPWYQQWWAYTLYILVLAALAYWAYSVKIKRVRMQEQLAYGQKEAAKLLELDQLKTQFFTNISHEFRTPLTLIIGPVEFLKKKYPADTMLDTMKRNAERLLSLINQLLDLGKMDAKEMRVNLQYQDMAAFFQTITNTYLPLAASRNISLGLQQNLPKALCWFDADKMEKIVGNLLSNAFKFTPPGKAVQLRVDYNADITAVNITLQDEGIGIPAADLGKIFDRFYQSGSQNNVGGTGIGLSLVKELVSLLNGEINVWSEAGTGTRFHLSLPLQSVGQAPTIETTSKVALVSLEPSPKALSNGHAQLAGAVQPASENLLLIVEDDDDLRNYIREVFEPHYKILQAKDGKQGFDMAIEAIPDIIISDLMMPGMDGFEFCHLVKTTEKTCHIPVVMLTAKASLETRLEGLGLGADDYLTKPFHHDEIVARVGNLVKSRAQLRAIFGKNIVDLQPGEVTLSPLDEVFVEKIKAVIDANISEYTFDVSALAVAMNMTPSQLRRKLKAVTNHNPVEFVRKYRLHRAAQLLSQKASNVSEAAFAVGFESPSYFTKAFQEEFGLLPSEYIGKTV